jgi:hypothetical protein
LEDRRDSLETIKSLSKKYQLEVGTQAMPVLIEILNNYRDDNELCCLALDTLNNVVMNDDKQQHNNNNSNSSKTMPADLAIQFSEMFLKDSANLILLFDLLDEFDFQLRFSTVKLLNSLIVNKTDTLQEAILNIPRGVSRLMDLLTDSREIIRNDALLLLICLTQHNPNANLLKLVAFESGFDRIMEIIESEGGIDGGIVVEDAFHLLINLLKNNFSNQSFFKEANYIKELCKFVLIKNDQQNGNDNPDDDKWSLQKEKNMLLLLEMIHCLVSTNNQRQVVAICQKKFNNCGLLHRICALLMSFQLNTTSNELYAQTIKTVAEMIRGNEANQRLFSAIMKQTNPPGPLIINLLMSMINEKLALKLR